jgi:Flp pilus assembly protein TadG
MPAYASRARRQGGAVAIVFSLCLVALLAVGGLVLDLSHLYVLKSELQNGADSAALAGAKEINLSAAGVTSAANKAIAFAAKNKYNFSTTLAITNANISFSSDPDGPWSTVSEASASPSNKSFIRVDTTSKSVNTYLMNVVGINSVATSGVAVAGRFVVDVTPMGVCAKSATKYGGNLLSDGRTELLEYGFRRGITYNVLELGAVSGSPSDPMLLNPVDSPPTPCSPSNSSVNFTSPFLCQGNSALASNAAIVYANTGLAKNPTERALNSRFDDYPGGTACIPATSPPDPNIHGYDYTINAASGGPAAWMTPAPTAASPTVLWSYSKAAKAGGSAGSYYYDGDFDVADWGVLYPGKTATAGYPATGTPYSQAAGNLFHTAPNPAHTSGSNRRLMNVVLVNCAAETSNSMACRPLPVLGTGRFFMQSKANLNGGTPYFFVEFAGLIAPVPNSEIKLYR